MWWNKKNKINLLAWDSECDWPYAQYDKIFITLSIGLSKQRIKTAFLKSSVNTAREKNREKNSHTMRAPLLKMHIRQAWTGFLWSRCLDAWNQCHFYQIYKIKYDFINNGQWNIFHTEGMHEIWLDQWQKKLIQLNIWSTSRPLEMWARWCHVTNTITQECLLYVIFGEPLWVPSVISQSLHLTSSFFWFHFSPTVISREQQSIHDKPQIGFSNATVTVLCWTLIKCLSY